jgi:hypothetical protein
VREGGGYTESKREEERGVDVGEREMGARGRGREGDGGREIERVE